MRVERGGKKKLLVAFHFQFANQAGWKCDECRKAGLETKRRCGWKASEGGAERVVWARKQVATVECPRSFITAASLAWVEEFGAAWWLGKRPLEHMTARDAEAFAILEREMRAEQRHEQRE